MCPKKHSGGRKPQAVQGGASSKPTSGQKVGDESARHFVYGDYKVQKVTELGNGKDSTSIVGVESIKNELKDSVLTFKPKSMQEVGQLISWGEQLKPGGEKGDLKFSHSGAHVSAVVDKIETSVFKEKDSASSADQKGKNRVTECDKGQVDALYDCLKDSEIYKEAGSSSKNKVKCNVRGQDFVFQVERRHQGYMMLLPLKG